MSKEHPCPDCLKYMNLSLSLFVRVCCVMYYICTFISILFKIFSCSQVYDALLNWKSKNTMHVAHWKNLFSDHISLENSSHQSINTGTQSIFLQTQLHSVLLFLVSNTHTHTDTYTHKRCYDCG